MSLNLIEEKTINSNRVNSRYSLKKIETEEYTETECETTFNFNNYKTNYRPLQKKIDKLDVKFLEWFIGFTEGDGSFIISKNKVYFDITQSIADVQVLYYIKKTLGFGKVLFRRESHRNVAVFYVTSKENFSRLVSIFNGNLVSCYRQNQFLNWLEVYNLQYNEKINPSNNKPKVSLTTSWLAGFIDAEGSFTGRVKYCRTSRLKKAVHLSLTISQKEKKVLSDIRYLFFSLEDKGLSYDKSWDGWRVSISSFTKLEKVMDYLNLNRLRSAKYASSLKTKLILNDIKLKKHLTLSGLKSIEKSIKLINKI